MGVDRMRNLSTVKGVSGGGSASSQSSAVSPSTGMGQAGFTLVELLIVVAIVAVLSSMAIPTYNQFIQTVKVTRTVGELSGLEREIAAYGIDNYVLPIGLADIGRAGMLDPWGRPYVYLRLPDPLIGTQRVTPFDDLNTDFDLYSMGLDGLTALSTNDPVSLDDVVRGRNGAAYGLASEY